MSSDNTIGSQEYIDNIMFHAQELGKSLRRDSYIMMYTRLAPLVKASKTRELTKDEQKLLTKGLELLNEWIEIDSARIAEKTKKTDE